MSHRRRILALLGLILLLMVIGPRSTSLAQPAPPVAQAPHLRGGPPIQAGDRVYTADQVSNTVSVIDPLANTLLGTIPLGNPQPDDLLGALYNRQIGVHGLGFSPDGRLLAVVNVTSNSLTLIETATNAIKGTVYLGRAPHEAFFTPDGKELWVAVRGQDYIAVIDPNSLREIDRIQALDGVAMLAFHPDGKVAFVDSSRAAEINVIDVPSRRVIARIPVISPFSPNLLVTPDGAELWLTHKDIGKVTVIDAQTYAIKHVLDTGRVSNHVNFVAKADGDYAYVTIGGENAVRVIRRGDPPRVVGTIQLGAVPHGLWPTPDSSRLYVGLEDGDAVQVIDTTSDQVVTTIPIGQSPQALVYVARGGAAGADTNLTRQGAGQPIVKAPLRPLVEGATARGGVLIRRLLGVDQLVLDVEGLTPGGYRVLLTDTARPPFGATLALANLTVGDNGRGRAQALMLLFDQQPGGVRLDHVVVEASDGSIPLSDAGAEGLPGPLTLTLPAPEVAGGAMPAVAGSAVGMDALGNVRAVAVVAVAGNQPDQARGEVHVFHRLGGVIVGVWQGEVTCLRREGATAILTGSITVGEERAQNIPLTGRAFRAAVTDGTPDNFQVQVDPPNTPIESCSAPTAPANTVIEGDLTVATGK